MKRIALLPLMLLAATPAFAHVGVGATSGFAAGFAHPLSGLDHMTVMVAVGLWAALKGGKALWVWPATFVSVMLVGGALGMMHAPIPFVEPGILASVVALGLLVALAVDLPVWVGVGVIGAFAVLHGHAHGMEVPESVSGIEYMAGFAVATAFLHGTGIAAATLLGQRYRSLVRIGGAACVAIGAGLIFGVIG